MLHALMNERDVLRRNTRVDLEADADRIGRRRAGRRSVGIQDRDLPEDADVLEPRRALHQRAYVEPIGAGIRGRPDGELEPRDLSGTDVRRGLDRDAVEARPSGGG